MKKFFLAQPTWIKAVNIIIIAVALFAMALTLMRCFNLFNFYSTDIILEISSLLGSSKNHIHWHISLSIIFSSILFAFGISIIQISKWSLQNSRA